MNIPYAAPSYKKSEFNCPVCNVYAHQDWYLIRHYSTDEVNALPSYNKPILRPYEELGTSIKSRTSFYGDVGAAYCIPRGSTPAIPNMAIDDASLSQCSHCKKYAFWIEDKIIYPVVSLAPMPSDDMPDDVKADYIEAASVIETSPRASSALLRLALQKLMPHLREKGKKLNDDIGSLVKKGLPLEIQKSLDVVRVIGNESVHPGTLDLKDDKETAYSLFDLLNFIVYDRITRPREIDALYSKLPASKKGIEN